MKEWITGRNPILETLRARRREIFRLFIAEGVEDSQRLNAIISLASARKAVIERVPRHRLDGIAENHQGAALEVSGYPYCALQDILQRAKNKNEPPFILILDLLQNPQNLGTLIRTADAVGVHGVLIPLRRAAGITPAVVTASAGASEHLLIAQANLAQAMSTLKEADIWIAGLEGSSEARPFDQVDLRGALAIVVGNEGEGMRDLVRRSCDWLVSLPMVGQIESLNAAVAGSVLLYQALLARRKAGTTG
jgi:23S rRNA (guanosine2251-2'-O)-methyltransferase